ncbi:COX15/CtaA family protein [Salisaeta longa]|uniref:COX15/CtaA family protein n=1 Tax=Salisaeta longa TaxID=503170 RepID=UPI0003B6D5A7|nr:COX15/CtaA family protein [Salisaeta longa]
MRKPQARAWRFRFTLLTLATTALLISWGAFVTSINAGMAVPDWPASFGSYDPLATGLPQWWSYTPVLAEHGHRLLGALVGFLTLVLTAWTWLREERGWVKKLSAAVLGLVIFQGILGGLRVTENSLTLAAIHASTAQIFFGSLVGLAVFTSDAWMRRTPLIPATASRTTLRRLTIAATGTLLLQIVLGAMLRQFGNGLNAMFAYIHIFGAFAVTGLVIAVFTYVQKHFDDVTVLRRGAWAMLLVVGLQFALGLFAYLFIIGDAAQGVRHLPQIVLTIAHVVVGSVLVGSTAATMIYAWHQPLATAADAVPGDGLAQSSAVSVRPSSAADAS